MRRALALLALGAALGAAPRVDAADVVVARSDGKLVAQVRAIEYPAKLAGELTSGLTNRLFARVSLVDAQSVIRERAVEISLRYDLWDESFQLVNTMDGRVMESRTLPGLAEAEAMLAALPLPALFDIDTLPATRELVLRVELLLNPIDREKMRMIRKWVSQNTAPPIGSDQVPSMSNTVFNRIFEQYSDPTGASEWRATATSATFRVDALTNAR